MSSDSQSLTGREKLGATVLLISVCMGIGGYFLGGRPSTTHIDFARVSRMSCNDNNNVPSKWEDGRIFIELKDANAVQIVMKNTGAIYLGKWQASGTTLSMVVDTGFARTGEMVRLRPMKKIMEDTKVIGVNSDGDDTIQATGFNVKCAIVRK